MISQIVILCSAFIGCCYCNGYMPYPYNGAGNGLRHICPLPTKPCKLQATMTTFNGTPAGSIESEPCACNGHGVCSSDWTDSTRVIRRKLNSESHKMALNMMFCQTVQPQAFCTLGEEALVVSGTTTIPTNVQSFNCRCRGNRRPLQLKQRRYNTDHLIYNTYVCSYHMATCANSMTHCMVIREDVVNYTCKCRKGMHCRTNENAASWEYPMYGYCEE